MSVQNIFKVVKGFKEDLKTVAHEIGETLPMNIYITKLKDAKEYQRDPEFVKEILVTTAAEQKQKEDKKRKQEDRKQKQGRKWKHDDKKEDNKKRRNMKTRRAW